MINDDDLERDFTLSRKTGWFKLADTPPRNKPVLYTRQELDALPRLDRRRYDHARSVWHANLGPIITPQIQAVYDELEEIVDSNRQDGDRVRSSAVLSAYPGLGKSTVATSFGVRYHRDQIDLHGPTTPEGHDRIPVAYVGLTAKTTTRSLNAELCGFYEHPGRMRGTATELGHRATDCVLSCQTRLIIIDDVHFLNMTRRDDRDVANHFKSLASQFPATFLFVGVGLLERELLTEGLGPADAALAQTARRWTTLSLDPFEIATNTGRRTWRSLLKTIERDLVLTDKFPGMLAHDLGDYLYARSTGHFASLMTLIARGCQRANKTNAERLTAELLDGVRNDAAAEAARKELEAAFEQGHLTTRVQSDRPARRKAA